MLIEARGFVYEAQPVGAGIFEVRHFLAHEQEVVGHEDGYLPASTTFRSRVASLGVNVGADQQDRQDSSQRQSLSFIASSMSALCQR
jgi:hypothetical protein